MKTIIAKMKGGETVLALIDGDMRVPETGWHVDRHGYVFRRVYVGKRRRGDGVVVSCCRDEYLHRIILGLKRGDRRIGDHINRDKLDCRRKNLRITDAKGNAKNSAIAVRTQERENAVLSALRQHSPLTMRQISELFGSENIARSLIRALRRQGRVQKVGWNYAMRKAESISISEFGRMGGQATARNLTPKQRHESARKAAKARWGKR